MSQFHLSISMFCIMIGICWSLWEVYLKCWATFHLSQFWDPARQVSYRSFNNFWQFSHVSLGASEGSRNTMAREERYEKVIEQVDTNGDGILSGKSTGNRQQNYGGQSHGWRVAIVGGMEREMEVKDGTNTYLNTCIYIHVHLQLYSIFLKLRSRETLQEHHHSSWFWNETIDSCRCLLKIP